MNEVKTKELVHKQVARLSQEQGKRGRERYTNRCGGNEIGPRDT